MVHSPAPPAPTPYVCLLVSEITKMKPMFSLLHLHLLLCAFLMFSHNPCCGKCIEEEGLALLELNQGLSDHYNLLSSWKIDDQDCCRWRGVVCHNRTGHVIRLHLGPIGDHEISYISDDDSRFSFDGELRPSLLKLPFLYHLDLSMVHHLSEIPSFLGSLSRLRYLNFSRNMIGGHIPSQLGNLSRLRSLDLSFNNFTGDIPYQLGSLYNLQYLDLYGNYGSLNVDSFDWLSHLSSLRELKMSRTNFTGATDWLHSIKSSSSISTIHMTGSQFCEVDPLSLSMANSSSSLKVISFTECSLPSSTLPLLISISSAVVDLSLSGNSLTGPIPDSLANIDSLQHLNFSDNELEGPIPKSLGNLCNLRTLDISTNQVTEPLQNALESLAGCARTSLQIINLSANMLEGPIPDSFANMGSLQLLSFASNDLEGPIPKSLGSLCNLQTLDVSYNNIREPIHGALDSLAGCAGTSLQIINLSGNMLTGALQNMTAFTSLRELYLQSLKLNGPIPDSFANMGSLQLLSFASNDLKGPIPKSLGSLCNLQTLNVSHNNISELIHDALDSLAGCARTSLQKIDLSFNKLKGSLPNITRFTALRELYLNDNLLEGFSSDFTFGPTSELVTLDLTRNNLRGTVPVSIGELANLQILRLQSNHLVGVITELHIHNMFNLLELDLSLNSLALNLSSYWTPPFQTNLLNLRSCKLGPEFPSWLRSQTYFSMIDMSNSDISDVVPSWFWNNLSSNLTYLNMSHNSLSGKVPNLMNIFGYELVFDLSSNLFYGSIPQFLSSATVLNLSNNTFHGSLSFLCAANYYTLYKFLDLSNNLLSGRLTECLMNMRNLAVINLGSNNFYGMIPDSIGWLEHLESLTLANNSFSGRLPLSLKNCRSLKLLDVAENKLTGPVPAWLGEYLIPLVVLSLRDNLFDGQIPRALCYLKSLQLLDLSSNNISGTIPRCVNNLTALIDSGDYSLYGLGYSYPGFIDGNYTLVSDSIYAYSSQVIWKGGKREYKQNLRLLKMIDLSRNTLSGSIPREMMSLVGLRALNLSSNMLTGRIPGNIGQLELVESLDLSANCLSGEIPYSLANLSYLSVLDLSNNSLSGKIPTSTQLQSFDPISYAGNPKLCGPPLPNKCPRSGSNSPSERAKQGNSKDEWFETIWFYSGSATGFFMGFWAVFGALALNTSARVGLFHFMENIGDWLYLALALKWARQQ